MHPVEDSTPGMTVTSRGSYPPLALLAVAAIAIQMTVAAAVLAAGSPQGDNAGSWPSDALWTAYSLADGTPVSDVENETGLGGCTNVNIASGATNAGAAPQRAST
jgi:hypothetical protein